MQHHTMATEVNLPVVAARQHNSLPVILAQASLGPTPDEPEFLGSWLQTIPDCQFEIVADLVGDHGETPALAGLTDYERRALLGRIASHLRSLQ